MSLSGSSASRKSICAMTRLASSSSMKVGRKMIRSLSSREKMSNARSPRGVCSITIGTSAIVVSFFIPTSSLDLGVIDEEIERQALAQRTPERREIPAFLHHTTDGRRWSLTRAGDLFELRIHVRLRGRDRLLVADGLQQERAPDRALGARSQLGEQLLVVPLDAVGIHALAPE